MASPAGVSAGARVLFYVGCDSFRHETCNRLYIGVFTAPDRDPSVVFRVIYGAVAFLNLIVPLGVALTYGVYSAVLAGFPYRSDKSRAAWVRISWLLGGWTIGMCTARARQSRCRQHASPVASLHPMQAASYGRV